MALSGGPASAAPLSHGQAAEAELFEDAVEGSPTASAPPVPWRDGEAAAVVSSSPPSVSIPQGDVAAEEEAYESPSASGHPAINGAEEESPSVSELRDGLGRLGVGSVSPPGQRARGTEEGNSTAPSGAASPGMEDSKPRSASAPPSPGPPGASSSSSSPVPQIRQHARHVRTSSFQRFRQQMQRAWKWGPVGGAERSPREHLLRTTVNIEAMANQKRQWYQLHSKSLVQNLSCSVQSCLSILVHLDAILCLPG
jgi:hypothetical protein